MRVPARLGCAAAVAALTVCATAHAEVTTLASRPYVAPAGFGVEGDGDSVVDDGALSSDGQWLVFASRASNLVPGDVNGDSDVFLRNNATGALTRIAAGRQPVISSNSAWIAFTTNAALVPEDRNFLKDVYVVNRDTLVFERVSVGNVGNAEGNDQSFSPSISADGNRVAFASDATTLEGLGDVNSFTDIFVRDRLTDTTVRVSQGSAGGLADGPSDDPAISADGNFVAFESSAGNLVISLTEPNGGDVDIFRRDLGGGVTEMVTSDEAGAEANAPSKDPSISSNGRYVAFDSLATNLTAGAGTDENNAHDVFRRDMMVGGSMLVSRTGALNQSGNSASFSPSISADGARVLFRSLASDLTGEGIGVPDTYLRDITGLQTYRVNAGTSPNREVLAVALTPDGMRAAFSSEMTNLPTAESFPGRIDVFLRGPIPGASPVVKASVASSPVTGGANGQSFEPDMSADGRYVAFSSVASNLVANDGNNANDVFRFDTTNSTTVRVTKGEGEFNAGSYSPSISADGRWVAFVTDEEGISPRFDNNGLPDVWVRDMTGPTGNEFDVVSVAFSGTSTGSGGVFGSSESSISADGRFVAFVSDHGDLIAPETDTNNVRDIFVRDRQLGVTTRVNEANGDQTSGTNVGGPALSADGSVVAFHSNATNLVPQDENGSIDVFVYEFAGDRTTRVSVADDGTPANDISFGAAVSADGRYVAFVSVATNLVPGDSPNPDIFVRDRVAGTTTKVSVNTIGEGANGASSAPRISGDGRFVVFQSTAGNLGGPAGLDSAYIHDRLRGATAFLATDAIAFGNRNSADPVISADGTRYAIVSNSTNWTTALAGYRSGDVNVWTGTTPRTTLLSINSDAPDPSQAGAPVTVTYTLTASSGTPVGLVTFSATSGEASCSVPVGAPACPLTFATAGVRTISAYYSGDTVSFPARSPGETHAVEGAGQQTGFTGETPLVAPDGGAGDGAGSSVASSDEFVVLGAPNGGGGEGAVYVFQRVTNASAPISAKSVAGLVAAKDLQPVATLSNPNGAAGLGDKWGAAVAIAPDGATIVIGAPGAGGAGGGGAAAMFARPGATWSNDSTPDAALVPAAGVGIGDKFGTAVAVGAGNMIAVGAPAAASGGGAAHVFVGAMPMGPPLTPTLATGDATASFGQSLAMSGGRLVVGAPNEGAGDNGAVRLYTVTATSVSAPTVLAPTGGAGFGDKWGTSVAIDGTTVVGGSPGASGGNGVGVVFQDTGSGMTQRGQLNGGTDAAGAGTGMAVAVAGDYIMLGAPLADVGGRMDQGRAFVFLQPDGGWQDASAVGSLASADGEAGDGYGSALALTRRGAIVGIPNSDVGLGNDQGQADSFIVDRIFRGAFE